MLLQVRFDPPVFRHHRGAALLTSTHNFSDIRLVNSLELPRSAATIKMVLSRLVSGLESTRCCNMLTFLQQKDLLNKHMESPDFAICRQDLAKIFKSNPNSDMDLARQVVLTHLLDRAGFMHRPGLAEDDDMTQELIEEVIGIMAAAWSVYNVWEDFELGYSGSRSGESDEDTSKTEKGKVKCKLEVDDRNVEFYSYDNELYKDNIELDEEDVDSCGHEKELAEPLAASLIAKGQGLAHIPSASDPDIQDRSEDLPPPPAHPNQATSESDPTILRGMLALEETNWDWSRAQLPDAPKTKHDKLLQFQVALAGLPISYKTRKGNRLLKWIYQYCIHPLVKHLLFKPLRWIWAKIPILIPIFIIFGPPIWVRLWLPICPYISMANRWVWEILTTILGSSFEAWWVLTFGSSLNTTWTFQTPPSSYVERIVVSITQFQLHFPH
jgi:hypothetical protein